jgi:hypothetical protein
LADFRSKAKLSFIGHYNYFVLPHALICKSERGDSCLQSVYWFTMRLLEQEKLGVPGYFSVEKKPQRQSLLVDENALLYRLIAAQAREVGKAKQTARGLRVFSTERLYKELKKREPEYDLFGGGVNYYDRFIEDTQLASYRSVKRRTGCDARSVF